jgi:lipoprotein-anchoring transpeptidase ErfK/SrfK
MVSTARTATPTGVFHIYKKRAVSFMKSKPEHRNKYNLDTPWVMTLKGRIAMHAVYWHDEFGTARSHGCVNLAPQDAKWIWDWTLPAVPEGWLRVDTAEPDEGTVVRIRK